MGAKFQRLTLGLGCFFALLIAQCAVAGISSAMGPGHRTISFNDPVVQAEPGEVKLRLHSLEDPGRFDINKERFEVIVPPQYSPKEAWGLFIWVDSSDVPTIPADWERVLAERKLLFVGAQKAGNSRSIFDRMRLAVCANAGMRARFNIDPARVYVSGFSGGARVASMLGIAWADMFTGAIPFMGVNFYTDIPAPNGRTYPPDFIPDDQALAIAKTRSRFMLVTGENDFNRADVRSVFENGFKSEKFQRVRLMEVPSQAHSLPSASHLEKGLEFLDGALFPSGSSNSGR